jgi:pilus assembly protein CpaE
MPTEHNILIASRDPEVVGNIESALQGKGEFTIQTRLLVNGHHDPLQDVREVPTILVLGLTKTSELELQALAARPKESRPALIIVGGDADSGIFRMAMQAGARDFLNDPIEPEELLSVVRGILDESEPPPGANQNRIVTFINAKGGSGSSFLAANYAHTSQVQGDSKTLLLDLDRQFAPLPQYLDVQPQASLYDALIAAAELDELAVEGFIARHASGLGLMSGNLALNADPETAPIDEGAALRQLLDILLRRHTRIVAEVPRHLDELGAAMLEASDQVFVVMQQSVPDLRDASRLIVILTKELGIAPGKIQPLVNRYDSRSNTTLDDIRRVLNVNTVHTVANDFANVSESIDMGVPLADLAPKSSVANALVQLRLSIEGIAEKQPTGILSRFIRR